MPEIKLVDICIATYQRPSRLERLLYSLLRQQVAPEVEYRIVVVDNDANGCARPVVDTVSFGTTIEMVYDIEPERNISLARNRAMERANGDYIAFIDDDEYAVEVWLQSLLDTLDQWNADAVFGPVMAEYPQDTPAWVKRGRFFERGRQPTGTDARHCATNNVLMSKKILQKMGSYFKPEFGRTGGEDTEFFYRMRKKGAKMTWCDTAVVYEPVDPSRMSASWLGERAFRAGRISRRVFVAPEGFGVRLRWNTRKFFYLTMALAFLPVSWVAGKAVAVKTLQYFLSGAGYFAESTGARAGGRG